MFQNKKVLSTALQILQQSAINKCCAFMASTEIVLFYQMYILIHTTVDLTA